MKRTEITCDTCGIVMPLDSTSRTIEVIFTTEQTEGRACSPYLTLKNMDLCADCLAKKLAGAAIFAFGAQGYNTYTFKNPSGELPKEGGGK